MSVNFEGTRRPTHLVRYGLQMNYMSVQAREGEFDYIIIRDTFNKQSNTHQHLGNSSVSFEYLSLGVSLCTSNVSRPTLRSWNILINSRYNGVRHSTQLFRLKTKYETSSFKWLFRINLRSQISFFLSFSSRRGNHVAVVVTIKLNVKCTSWGILTGHGRLSPARFNVFKHSPNVNL